MRIQFLPSRVLILSLLLSLISCGEMDTIISVGSSYAVDATVDGRYLDEAAVVDSSALVRPVFSSDVADDPDAEALRVVLTGPDGEAASVPVVYRKRSSSARSESGDGDGLVSVDSLSAELPGFALPAELPVGRYSLRFEVLGESGILFTERRSIFYTAAEPLALISLASFPPGSEPASDSPLFPVSTMLLLQAGIEAGDDFDPFLVWTSGGKRLAASRASEGGARLLWETPAGAGFYRVDVSLYPTEPLAGETESLIADSRSLTIATSPDAATPGLPNADASYDRIYRFLGNLKDGGASASGGESLVPAEGSTASWLPFDSGYGIAAGPRRSFASNVPALPSDDGSPVACRVVVRAALLGEGLLWKASLSGVPGAALILESTSSGPRLTLRTDGESSSIRAETDSPFSSAVVLLEIELRPSAADPASWIISLMRDGESAGSIPLDPAFLNIPASRFSLGGSEAEAEDLPDTVAAIVDELAFLALPAESASPSPGEGGGEPENGETGADAAS